MSQNLVLTAFEKWLECFYAWRDSRPQELVASSFTFEFYDSIRFIYLSLTAIPPGERPTQESLESHELEVKQQPDLSHSQVNLMERSVAGGEFSDIVLPSDSGSHAMAINHPLLVKVDLKVEETSPDETFQPWKQSCKYRKYTRQEKKEAVRLLQEGTLSLSKLSRKLGIPAKNIRRWKVEGLDRDIRCGRKVVDLGMEETLRDWLKSKWINRIPVRNCDIKEAALRLTDKPNFKASKGWLKKFVQRCRKHTDHETESSAL